LAGINVGFISEISFEKKQIRPKSEKSEQIVVEEKKQSEEEPKSIVKVKVQMKVDTAYQERIRTDSIASVVTQGLLGDRMIYITVGSSDDDELKDGDEIVEVKNPTGFSQLVQKSDDLILKAEELVESLDKVMDAVVDGDGLVHDVIFEKKSSEVLDSAEDMFASLDEMGQNLEEISEKINNGQGTLGALVHDESLYNDLKTLLGKANRNRLIRAVIRYTMETKEKEQLK
jgi:phospholipid/cholesterol/gamma-HCH transport system substrate-binding protein